MEIFLKKGHCEIRLAKFRRKNFSPPQTQGQVSAHGMFVMRENSRASQFLMPGLDMDESGSQTD